MENERIRILFERQKSKFSLKSELRSISTKFKPILIEEDKELNGIIESQRKEIDHTIASDDQLRRDRLLLQEQVSKENRDLREAHIKSLHEMEELKRVQRKTSQESINLERKSYLDCSLDTPCTREEFGRVT